MKKIIWALICLAAALAAKFLPHFDLAWRINEDTHRGISINDVFFWALLIAAAMLFLAGILSHRGGSSLVK